MKINELTTKLGISRKAILYYESEGLITPSREQNNYRHFDQSEVEKLKVIYKLRLANVPVATIKQYLITEDKSVIKDYMVNKQKLLEDELTNTKQLQVEYLESDYIEPIKAINYIAENINGPLGAYISSHFRYYFEKDDVTYQGNEEVFKQIVQYIESNDWSVVNQVLTESPELELSSSISDATYKYVANLKHVPDRSKELVQQVSEHVSPIKVELEKVNYYTKFIPLIRQLSPSYNLYLQKIEWLELKSQGNK